MGKGVPTLPCAPTYPCTTPGASYAATRRRARHCGASSVRHACCTSLLGVPACLFRLLLCGKALEQRFQPCQQALFVTIAQGHLHLAARQGDMDIRTGRSLWQCENWLTRGTC